MRANHLSNACEGFISFSSSSCGKLVVPLIASGLVGPLNSVTRFWNKKLPNFSLKGPKCSHYGFNIKNYILKFAPTVAKYLGYICKKKCHQDLSKLGQSGHTAFEWSRFGGKLSASRTPPVMETQNNENYKWAKIATLFAQRPMSLASTWTPIILARCFCDDHSAVTLRLCLD